MSIPNESKTSEETEINGYCSECQDPATLDKDGDDLLSQCCGAVSYAYGSELPEG